MQNSTKSISEAPPAGLWLRFRRPSLKGRGAVNKLVASAALLALVVGLLTASLLFTRHTTAAPGQHQTTLTMQDAVSMPRLEAFTIYQGFVYHKWSDDNGVTWSNYVGLSQSVTLTFAGSLSVASDGPGRLNVFATNVNSANPLIYLYNTFSNGSWSGWRALPNGELRLPSGVGDIPPISFLTDVTATSWGPGRMDLFQNWLIQGAPYLMHTWENNYSWSGVWESLGPSMAFQGSLAAASLGAGHLDVFGRGPNNELEDKWFANGSWHQGWSNLGGTIASSPTAVSDGFGLLSVFARDIGSLGFTVGIQFDVTWGNWTPVYCCVASDRTNPIAAASAEPLSINVLFINQNHALQRTEGNLVSGWPLMTDVVAPPDNSTVAATVWDAPPPPPTPTATTPPPPRRTPTPSCFISCP